MVKAISAPFTKGVNFTHWLNFWRGTKSARDLICTKQEMADAKSLGCDVIRFPIYFEGVCSDDGKYTIKPYIFDCLDIIAKWAEELDLWIIFDFHNNTHSDSKTNEDVESVLAPIWTQVANRYKDGYKKIVFELMNEPHGIKIQLWNEIIGRVFKLVRSIDTTHYIICGGADWNSFDAMCTLPDFHDDKVIYTFHFYDPHLFTHQGAVWCHMEKILNIPFPYDKDRMPEYPDASEQIKQEMKDYSKNGTVEAVSAFFDKYAEFSQNRNAPVYCGEFGAFMPFIKPEERVNWYKIVAGLLEEKGIARTSWDYYGGFGIFNKCGPGMHPKFPEDLNVEIVRALGLQLRSE